MNILFLGDIVAESGCRAVISCLPALREKYHADFIVANGENAADGKGITRQIYESLIQAGIDVVTLGNHAFSHREIMSGFNELHSLVKPENLEPVGRGQSFVVRECLGRRIAVANILGAVFMNAAGGDPFLSMNRLLERIQADIILVDFHAEATSEKEIFYRLFRSEVTAVIGTHTHVQTADEKIVDGCAFISDVGMCGPYDSVLGRDPEEIMANVYFGSNARYRPAEGPSIISAVLIGIDDATDRAVSIERIQIRP